MLDRDGFTQSRETINSSEKVAAALGLWQRSNEVDVNVLEPGVGRKELGGWL